MIIYESVNPRKYTLAAISPHFFISSVSFAEEFRETLLEETETWKKQLIEKTKELAEN